MPFPFGGQSIESLLFTLSVLVWVISEGVRGVRTRTDAATNDRYSLMLLRVCISGGMVLAAFAVRIFATAFFRTPLVFGVGIGLVWAGVGLRWWCFQSLGRYFTFRVMTSSDQTVVTTGPYRVLRHPSYTGLLLALAGVGVSLGNWLSLASAIVVPLLGIMYRIHVEESALAAAVGDAYTTYASSRKRLIPFVW